MKEYSFSDICIGLKESFEIIITNGMLEKFCNISGDKNPLHIDKEYAISKGFEDRVVYGMLTSSFYSTLVGMYLPGKYCLLQSVDTQFLKPVFIGNKLTIEGKVSYINEAYKQVEIKALIVNEKNIKVSKALIKVGLID